MATVTDPILLDSTGQEIVEALETIAENMGTSAGHTIQNDTGTDMQRRDKLQFKGVYVEDDQTNDVTKVDICRTMTKAQMEALSGEALKGFINTSDEPDSLPLTAEWVAYDDNTSVKDKIDNIISRYENVSVTTSASGAFIIPNNINYTRVLNIVCTSRVNTVILLRGADNYCFAYDLVDGVLTPLPSTTIMVTFTYY